MKKLTLATIFAAACALAQQPSSPLYSILIPQGIWAPCLSPVRMPFLASGSCESLVPGTERYLVAVVPSGPRVTNFRWHLTGFRFLDGRPVDMTGTFDRDFASEASHSESFEPGRMAEGFVLTVTEREDVMQRVGRQ